MISQPVKGPKVSAACTDRIRCFYPACEMGIC